MVVLFMEVMDTLASLEGFAQEMASLIKREVDIKASEDDVATLIANEWLSRYNQLVASGNYRSLRSLARDVMLTVIRKYSLGLGGRELEYWGDALANAFVTVAKIYDDVEPALNELSNLGVQMYILTNLDNDIAKKILLKNGLLRFFKGVISSDLTRAGKPNARIFNAALYRAKISKDDALIVSGLIEDIIGGKLSQIKTVFVNRRKVNLTVKPDYIIGDLTELPKLLANMSNP
ncbi:HAD family hydrolase [Caldivirga sp. UBA161]|uniref:HAD family hydrolase n=1 Tax=Caldivirga sp. UBA161 TaxID=1915569 RepID=UPI0025C2CEA0|nr:HAD family hydrolase [Caldivirga sp. UBA161]